MNYITFYRSPLGKIILTGDDEGLSGLWFEGSKYCPAESEGEYEEREIPMFTAVKEWLDIYFSGREPDFMPPLHMSGTPFQMEVWELLREIPYGRTVTYGSIAKRIALRRGLEKMSAQAVGGAVGRNRIAIIVPCHRVVGENGSLTGYAGGIKVKTGLLEIEGADMARLFVPKRGTAL